MARRACSTPPPSEEDVGHRRGPAAVPRRADPVRRDGPQPRRAASGSTTATASSPPTGAPPAIAGPALAVTGACMYMRREVIERVGLFDEAYPMAYEDVDWCLRAWQAGFRVLYFPAAQLYHHESVTRGTDLGERERASQRVFWERWGDFFDAAATVPHAPRRAAADRLRDRGHRRRRRAPRHLRAPQPPRRARARGRPVHARGPARVVPAAGAGAQLRGLRGARRGARPGSTRSRSRPGGTRPRPCGGRASCAGIPVYFVQDIETSYYPDDERARHAVLDSYRPEFRYMTISSLEPRAAARAGPGGGADPAGDRSRDVPPARGRARAATTWCSRSGARTR